MTETLFVHYERHCIGELRLREQPEERFCFRYTQDWRTNPEAFPISISLPLADEEYVGHAAHAFFANLLPEGSARTAVCRRLGVSEGNDFALLRAIGGECAGALVITTAHTSPPTSEPRYEQLRDDRLQRLVTDHELVPLLLGGRATRLSLAGAQNKLPVAVLDGVLHLPLDTAPSTHILKLPDRRHSHLPVNEAFVMGLARHVGFEVVDAELTTRTDPPSLLVRRYDRVASEDPWPVVRLHQEDFCQALGLLPTRKYEQEGGPTLLGILELLRAQSSRPLADVNRLIQWQAFNIIVGNSDGHGKNLSILREGFALRLAPFYDLLSTRHYVGLDRNLALGVAQLRDPDRIRSAQWESFARSATLSPRTVLEIVRGVSERIRTALPSWIAEFRERYGRRSILQTLPKAIDKRARTMARVST